MTSDMSLLGFLGPECQRSFEIEQTKRNDQWGFSIASFCPRGRHALKKVYRVAVGNCTRVFEGSSDLTSVAVIGEEEQETLSGAI